MTASSAAPFVYIVVAGGQAATRAVFEWPYAVGGGTPPLAPPPPQGFA